ncbi:MAG: hypothetical protein ACP5LG_07925 [Conexivisphaera sp.]
MADGSSDGTERILERLAKNSRIRVYRLRWSAEGEKGEAIGSAYNALLRKARLEEDGREWVVEVQANEVFHEDSHRWLRQLPEIFPGKAGFLIPYRSLHGTYMVEALWRLRYAHMDRELVIRGDAVALNSRERYSPARHLRMFAMELWKTYVRPTDPYQRFFWYAEEGLEPAPIVPAFRYRVLLPGDTLEKHRRHVELYRGIPEYVELYRQVEAAGREARSLDEFWRITARDFCRLRRCGHALPAHVPLEEHPRIMRDVLASGADRYSELDRSDLVEEIASA